MDKKKNTGKNNDKNTRKDFENKRTQIYGKKTTVGKEKAFSKDMQSSRAVKKDVNIKDNREAEKGKQPVKKQKGECQISHRCGGCDYQGVPYEAQLQNKQKHVKELLGEFGKVEAIRGMEFPKYYRNKVHHVIARDRKGNVIDGFYEEKSHNVVGVDTCMLEDEQCQKIIKTITTMIKSFRILVYDEDTEYGLLRHVMVRKAVETGEIMVVLVVASPIFPSKNNFVKALRQKHPEITTVVLNVNDKSTSMVLGERNITLYGPGFIKDRLCGRVFRLSPNSFYQINHTQTEVLYQTAIDFAELKKTDTIIDAYCGIGTIGLVAAKDCGKVIGVELNKDAVKDARINAKENKLTNAEFYAGDAGEFMTAMAEKGEKAQVVFMDPPRSGSTEQFMDAVAILAPEKVVYVSCNPDTQARDLKYMRKKGYRVERIVPVDMFPFTNHVETVVLMTRKDK